MKTIRLLIIALICTITTGAQNIIPLIGNEAPSFEANTTNGKLVFPNDFGKSWKILLSHPKDFTPVCTSEILQLARMQAEFENLGVKIAIISTDDLLSHQQWKQSMEDILANENGNLKINFPLIDDKNARVSNKYGMLHAWDNTTRDVRGVYVIDPENKVQSINFYPMNIGRNFVELKRLVVALQYSSQENVLTPVNWEVGDDVLMPYMPNINSELSSNKEPENEYYKVGINLWYKKGSNNLVSVIDK
jgi:peroxiredoxin (alkyl hydroperoxide reductase subunit C)